MRKILFTKKKYKLIMLAKHFIAICTISVLFNTSCGNNNTHYVAPTGDKSPSTENENYNSPKKLDHFVSWFKV